MAAADNGSSPPDVQPPRTPHSRSHLAVASQTASWSHKSSASRGRQPKDPHAVTSKFECASLQELERNLRSYLHNPPAEPEHSACELTIWAGASFLVQDPTREEESQSNVVIHADSNDPRQNDTPATIALSVLDALQPVGSNRKDTMKRQRAIAKVCVAAIQKVDGYRYSFHNSWRSGEDDAFRFSFYCNDSLLNKDRVASGKSGSAGKRAHKPVYDCKGILSIKFSSKRQCIDVIYKHMPIHGTYEERAPPPRKESKRRADWEARNPDKIKKPRSSEDDADSSKRSNKRQRKLTSNSLENQLLNESRASLLELMRIEGDESNQPLPSVVPPSPPFRKAKIININKQATDVPTHNANNELRKEFDKLKSDFEAAKKTIEEERKRSSALQERCTQLEAEIQTLREASTASMGRETAPQAQTYPQASKTPRHGTPLAPKPQRQVNERQMYAPYSNRPGCECVFHNCVAGNLQSLVHSPSGSKQTNNRQPQNSQWTSNYFQQQPDDPEYEGINFDGNDFAVT